MDRGSGLLSSSVNISSQLLQLEDIVPDHDPESLRPAAARVHKLAEFTTALPGVIPGIILFLLAGTWQTVSTGQLSTGVSWVFTAGLDSSLPKTLKNVLGETSPDAFSDERTLSRATHAATFRELEPDIDSNSEHVMYPWTPATMPKESHLPDLGVVSNLKEQTSVKVAAAEVLSSPQEEEEGYSYDDVSGLPTALQVFIVFGFLSVHQLITFTVFNVLLRFDVIRDDNLVVAYIISITGFFGLVLAAGDTLGKACALTAAYFTCVTLFLFFLVFLVKTQARWYSRQDRDDAQSIQGRTRS